LDDFKPKSPKIVAHLSGKNIFARQNQLGLKGSWGQKNQKPHEQGPLGSRIWFLYWVRNILGFAMVQRANAT
jgi:hypothetical protein